MELPRLKQLYNRYKEKGFEIVVVDDSRDTANAMKFIEENDLPYLFFEDGEAGKGIVQETYGVFRFPTSFLIDHRGRVMYYHLGLFGSQRQQLEEELQTLLELIPKQANP